MSHYVLQSEEKMISHLGKVLGAVQFRDVWTDTAEILIRQVLILYVMRAY